jgi:hypothetical protein
VTAHAQSYAFNDLGLGNTYDYTEGYGATGPSSGYGVNATAFEFTSLASGKLASLTIGATWYSGANSVTACLYSDVGGAPGTALETWVSGTLPTYHTIGSPVTVFNQPGVSLTKGASYFFEVGGGSSDGFCAWNLNSTGQTAIEFGLAANGSAAAGPWSSYGRVGPTGAFSIEVTPKATSAPSPAAFLPFGLGAGALFLRRRR